MDAFFGYLVLKIGYLVLPIIRETVLTKNCPINRAVSILIASVADYKQICL